MRNIKVVVSYDGTDYFGFQFQPNVPTIEGELVKALSEVVEKKVSVCGAGRTDSGVHALGQVINFRTDCAIPHDKLCIAVNRYLPCSIRAMTACEVSEDFNARHCAIMRHYRYTIANTQVCNAQTTRYSWHVAKKLDLSSMREGASHLVGTHDFISFSAASDDEISTVRNLFEIKIAVEDSLIKIDIYANAFLRSMARKIVGTLFEVGLGQRDPQDVAAMLYAVDRRCAGKVAPACGLCLMGVHYLEKDA